jgi:hypothetical protein
VGMIVPGVAQVLEGQPSGSTYDLLSNKVRVPQHTIKGLSPKPGQKLADFLKESAEAGSNTGWRALDDFVSKNLKPVDPGKGLYSITVAGTILSVSGPVSTGKQMPSYDQLTIIGSK